MPNWCANGLTVFGPEEAVVRFVQQACGLDSQYAGAKAERLLLSFHSFVPILGTIRARRFDLAGIDAERRAWGVKWGACDSRISSRAVGHVTYSFETAWKPPYSFVAAVAKMYPELKFCMEFGEEGYGYIGMRLYTGGEVVADAYLTRISLPDDHMVAEETGDESASDLIDKLCAKYDVPKHSGIEMPIPILGGAEQEEPDPVEKRTLKCPLCAGQAMEEFHSAAGLARVDCAGCGLSLRQNLIRQGDHLPDELIGRRWIELGQRPASPGQVSILVGQFSPDSAEAVNAVRELCGADDQTPVHRPATTPEEAAHLKERIATLFAEAGEEDRKTREAEERRHAASLVADDIVF